MTTRNVHAYDLHSKDDGVRALVGMLEVVKRKVGPALGIAVKFFPESSNYRDRLRKIHALAQELQNDLSKS